MGRAIVRSPQAFLMDEPLSNLDAQLRVEMRLEIARIQRLTARRMATVYVPHDQIEAMTLGDRVAVMRSGKPAQDSATHPKTCTSTRRTTSSPGSWVHRPMNLLRVETRDSTDGDLAASCSARRSASSSRRATATSHALPRVDGPGVVFGVRPEDVEVLDRPSADALTTRVERREALGAEILVHLSLVDADGDNAIVVNDAGAVVARPMRLVAKMGPRSGVSVGDHLSRSALQPDHFHFFDADSGQSLACAPQ